MSTQNEFPDQPMDGGRAATSPSTWSVIKTILKPLASLQVSVVLFAMSLVLVFFGTLAQMEDGIWTVVSSYFRTFLVWIPFQLIAKFGMVFFGVSPDAVWTGSFPFPAGYTIGIAMMINLVTAHLVRFRTTWKRSGIILIHGGMILMLIGEVITGEKAVESKMYLQQGELSNYLDDSRNIELAVTWTDEDGVGRELLVPGAMLKQMGSLSNDQLPVDIEVLEYHKNTTFVETPDLKDNQDTLVFVSGGRSAGVRVVIVPSAEEAGVKSERDDAPAVKVVLRDKKTGDELGTHFLSLWQYRNYNNRLLIGRPHRFTADGRTYDIELRNRRVYKPYTVQLDKFEHKVYPGTVVAKDYASTITMIDQERGDQREGIRIWMNNPLRYRGETFYQSGVLPEDSGTVLQVVNNPGWMLPYVSCVVVTLGMLVHFSITLTTFLTRRFVR